MYVVKESHSKKEFDTIVQLRYEILRKPWNKAFETSTDDLEENSVNAYITGENGKAIACGRLQENECKVGQIRFMAVDTSYQGKGLGKLIVTFLEEKGREMGIIKIELHARENAVKFYKSQDYILKEKSYNLWDIIQHYLMEKEL